MKCNIQIVTVTFKSVCIPSLQLYFIQESISKCFQLDIFLKSFDAVPNLHLPLVEFYFSIALLVVWKFPSILLLYGVTVNVDLFMWYFNWPFLYQAITLVEKGVPLHPAQFKPISSACEYSILVRLVCMCLPALRFLWIPANLAFWLERLFYFGFQFFGN